MTRAGHVALAGRPNAGKSTLLNALTGSHLAIVSPKAQATRIPVTGLVTDATSQIVFHDLPGLLDPAYLLQERLRALALARIREVDLVVHLHPAPDPPIPPLRDLVAGAIPGTAPILPVYTQVDRVAPGDRAHLAADVLQVSATTGEGLDALLAAIRARLPEAPFAYDPDALGTQPLRFFASEYLREAAFDLLEEELPYALTAEIDEFREGVSPVYIRAILFVERPSQKGMLIGQGGRTIKAIGAKARASMEALLGEPVYLETWVKVLPRWRRDAQALRRFGFVES